MEDEGYDVAGAVEGSYAVFLVSACLHLSDTAFLMASLSLSAACCSSPLC